ncbi:hypothetical protein IFO70_30425 [Phormidium tenue FACHB-886]|nr:hypothetical protein [Phormidium tenue FACHB-886]
MFRDGGNRFRDALNLGGIKRPQTLSIQGSVGAGDRADFFRFKTTRAFRSVNIRANLTDGAGTSAEAAVFFQPSGGDRQLFTSFGQTAANAAPSQISLSQISLPPGTYDIRVIKGMGESNYSINFRFRDPA